MALFALAIQMACSDNDGPVNISVSPEISFESIEFMDSKSTMIPDTIAITIQFVDLDGDLGLGRHELDSPYHSVEYFYVENNQLITAYDLSHPGLIKIGASDTLPPFNYCDYRLHYDETTSDFDTIYCKENIHNFNMINEVLIEENGEFQIMPADLIFRTCFKGFNVRFPEIPSTITGTWQPAPILEIEKNGPHAGLLTYSIVSLMLKHMFTGKRIKLRIYIFDRALNKSNVVESDALQF